MKYMITCRMLTGLILWSLFGFSTASLAGKWEEKANLPTPRWGLATAVVNGKIYAIGGQDNTPDVNKVEVYDPKRDTWDVINSVPTGRIWLAASVVKGKIYVIGGTKDNLTALAAMEEYDPKTNQWTKKADMPTPRMALATAVVGGRIYAIGGATDLFFPSGAVEVYHPATDTWEQKPDMPKPRWGIAAAALLSRIYVFGGAVDHFRKKATDMVEEYDTKTDTWTQKTNLWIDLYGMGATFVNSGKIYVIGGQKWKGKGGVVIEDWALYHTVAEYDPKQDKWEILRGNEDQMPTPRSAIDLSVVDGKIYAIGGWAGGAGGNREKTQVYTPPGWPFPDKFSVDPREKMATVWGALKTR